MRRFLIAALLVLGAALLFALARYRAVIVPVVSMVTHRIGSIDFYGTQGVDVEAVRAKLPVRVGDFSAKLHFNGPRRPEFEQATGHSPIRVELACCDDHGREYAFVGLGGQDVATAPSPAGSERLSKPLLDLYNQFFLELFASISRGNAAEDHSTGYALSRDPALRAIQLRMREAALTNEAELLAVSANSGDAPSRAAAIHLLGYAQHSKQQMEELVNAARDADGNVRNNATRALGVLIEAFPDDGKGIDLTYFLDLMNSTVWTDRNKASFLLEGVSRSRDPAVLATIRAKAFDSLVEMAQWKAPHRGPAVLILGRMAGIDEGSLKDMADRGLGKEILAKIH